MLLPQENHGAYDRAANQAACQQESAQQLRKAQNAQQFPWAPAHQVQHKSSSIPMGLRVGSILPAHPSPHSTFRHTACVAARGARRREPPSCKTAETGYCVWGLGYFFACSVPSAGTCHTNCLGQPEPTAAVSSQAQELILHFKNHLQ